MKNRILIFLSFFIFVSSYGQNNLQHGILKVSINGHYLEFEDGTPFFWLGDTGWELFHRLKLDEINLYLENRQKKVLMLFK